MNTNLKFYLLTFAICILLFITILAPYIVPFDPYEQNLANTLQAPNTIHLLGTDKYGRDIFSRILIGAQTTIFSSLFLVIISSVFGSLIGVICGYFGKNLDNLLMRITDIFLAFPGIIFAIALVGILGGSIFNAMLALSLISWPKFALLARSQKKEKKNSLFIKASIINGSSDFKIIYKHILPNIFPILLTTATLNIGTMIMEIAGLSFLGLGAMPPSAEWGAMMSSGRIFLQIAPWMILAPAAAIFLTVLLFNLFADVLNEKLDPKQLS